MANKRASLSSKLRFWVLLIILLSFTLRVYGLDDRAVDADEAYVYTRWIGESFRAIMVDDLVVNNHTLAQILDRAALLLLGNHLFSLRWQALFFSVLGLACLYRLSCDLFDRPTALVSAFLLAVSPYAINASLTLRGYSGLIHLPVLAGLLALKAVRTNRWRCWLGLSLTAVIMMYTHLFTALAWANILLFAVLAWGMQYRKRVTPSFSFDRLLLSAGLTTVLLAGLYTPVWMNLTGINLAGDTNAVTTEQNKAVMFKIRPQFSASLWTNLRYFSTDAFLERDDGRHRLAWPGLSLFVLLVTNGIVFGLKRRLFRFRILLLLGWALLPFLEIWVLQKLWPGFPARPTYLGFILPGLLLLTGFGLIQLSRWKQWPGFAGYAVIGLPLAVITVMWYPLYQDIFHLYANGNWQSIGNYLSRHSRPDDLIVCQRYHHAWRDVDIEVEDGCTRTLNYRRKADLSAVMPIYTVYEWAMARLNPDTANAATRSGRVWLVVWDVPPQVDLTAVAGIQTEFNRFGRSLVILADQQPTYIANLTDSIVNLNTTVAGPPEQVYLYNLLIAPLAAAAGRAEIAHTALAVAEENRPNHPEAGQKLARVEQLTAALMPPQIEHSAGITFGQMIELRGYNLTPLSAKPGDNLHITLFWQATAPVPRNYTMFLHLRNQAGQIVTQLDTPPLGDSYPTKLWQVGQPLIGRQTLSIPPDIPPGDYDLVVGLYDPDTMERLSLSNDLAGENAWRLITLSVQ